MSNLPKPLTKYMVIYYVTLASNSENFYFSPNCILNFRKVTKFGGNWLKDKKLWVENKLGWNIPPMLIGLKFLYQETHDRMTSKYLKYSFNKLVAMVTL